MDIVDTGLEVGAGFDWISPLAGIIGDVLHGGGHTFLIDIGASPMTGAEIERMLRKRGIRTWGAMIVGDTFMLSVETEKARYAAHLLEQAGIPLESAAPSGSTSPAARPSPGQARASFASRSRIMQALRR